MPPGKRNLPFDWNKYRQTKNYSPRGVDMPDINAPAKTKYTGLPSLNDLLRGKNGPTGLDDIVKDGERHTAGQPKYASTGVNGGSGGLGGNTLGGGNAGVAGIPAPDPLASGNLAIDSLYAKLLGSLKATNNDTAALHDAARKSIEKDFGDSAKSMYDTYMNSRSSVDNSAKGLGIDLNASKIGQEWDANLRRVADVSNANLDTNLAWVDKMKTLRGSQFAQMEADAVNEQTQRKLELAMSLLNTGTGGNLGSRGGGGGGGGRNGGGGRSSSGSVTTKATDNSQVLNVGDYEALMSLSNNPAAQALFDRHYKGAGGDVTGAIASLQALMDKSAYTSKVKGPFGIGSKALTSVKKTVNNTTYKNAKLAQEALIKISGLYNNPNTKQTVNSSSSKKS